jgi:TolB protein
MERIESPSRPSSSRRRSASLLAAACAGTAIAVVVVSAQEPPPPTPPSDAIRRFEVGGGRPQRFAVPDCVPKRPDQASASACRVVTDVLRQDLQFEGIFQFVPENLLRAVPPLNPEAPRFDDWKAIDAQILVSSQAEVKGDALSVSMRLFFVETGQPMLTRHYTGRLDRPRIFAHQASDDILAQVQYRGVARTQIVFASDRDSAKNRVSKELYLVDYDGYNPRRVTVNSSLNILPAWSPGGRAIAYTSYRRGVPEIFLAWIFEARSQELTPGRTKAGQSFAPSFSPDGKRVAFANSRTGNSEIWVANVDGSGLRQITQNSSADTAPCWSPTGQEIAFTSDRGGTPQIWVMDAEGLNVRRVTSVGSYNDGASWNPSKEFPEIAYASRIEGRFQVAVVDLATRQVRQVSEGRGSCESPSWAPSGRHLAFSCSRGGTWQVNVSDRQGRRFRTLAAGPGNNTQPDWGPWPSS